MGFIEKIKRELVILGFVRRGFSRGMGAYWYKKCQKDTETYKNQYSLEDIKKVHKRGYLASSIKKYNLLKKDKVDYITDFEYSFLQPFNNSFSKWIEDIYTTDKVLKDFDDVLPHVYYSIVKRGGNHQVYVPGINDKEYSANDIINTLREKKNLILRPSKWISNNKIYRLSYRNGSIYVII